MPAAALRDRTTATPPRMVVEIDTPTAQPGNRATASSSVAPALFRSSSATSIETQGFGASRGGGGLLDSIVAATGVARPEARARSKGSDARGRPEDGSDQARAREFSGRAGRAWAERRHPGLSGRRGQALMTVILRMTCTSLGDGVTGDMDLARGSDRRRLLARDERRQTR